MRFGTNMRRYCRVLLAVVLGVTSLCLSGMSAPQASAAITPQFTVRGLGSLGGGQTVPVAINDAGQVVGFSNTASGERHAFIWETGVMTDLGVSGTESSALDINTAGQVLVRTGAGGAYLWDGGTTRPVTDMDGSHGLNDLGQVVGSSNGNAAVWDDGTVTVLPRLVDDGACMALDLNDAGVVGGACFLDSEMSGPPESVIWRAGVAEAVTGEGVSRVNALGDGIANGGSLFSAFAAFITTDGTTLIPGLDPTADPAIPQAHGLNDQRQVSGSAYVAGVEHAFLWQATRLLDLNARIPASSGWVLNDATALNNHGRIVGTGVRNGQERAYLLIPRRNNDTVAPSIDIRTPLRDHTYLLNEPATVDFDCSDLGGSGLATCTGTTPDGSRLRTATVGNKTFVVRATDAAGNIGVARIPYTVRYAICPLYDQDAEYANSRVLTLRFQICDARGRNYSDAAVAVRITELTPGPLPRKATESETYEFTYVSDNTSGSYRYRLNLRRLEPGIHTLHFSVGGQSTPEYTLTIRVVQDSNLS